MPFLLYRGRLIDHIHLRVSDLEASKRFYRAALAAIGREPTGESVKHIVFDELWIDAADAAGPSRVHLAFQAADRDAVARFHAAGCQREAAIMVVRGSVSITLAIMQLFCSIPTDRMSKPFITVR